MKNVLKYDVISKDDFVKLNYANEDVVKAKWYDVEGLPLTAKLASKEAELYYVITFIENGKEVDVINEVYIDTNDHRVSEIIIDAHDVCEMSTKQMMLSILKREMLYMNATITALTDIVIL